jgi:hypothetical protein
LSDIIREVDEEIRRENWQRLWKRYGKFLFAAAVGAVAVTAAVVGWRAYDKDQRLKQGNNFAAAVATAESSESPAASADAMAALAHDAAAGYAMLARFREAMLRAEGGEREAAIAIYDALAEDNSVEPMFRDLAVLYSVRVQTDTGDAAALIERLAPLTAEDGAWRYSARELTAILHLRVSDMAAARETFQLLADDLLAPEGLRARAAEMLRATAN